MASTLATVMVNQPVSILRREPRARILRHAHSHHRSLSAVSSALANVTPPGSPDRTCSTEEEEAHVEEVPAGLPDVASQIPGLFEESGCAVVAHRGLGMNLKPGRGIRENTVASIIAAHDFGADWSEFDVQVTKDGVPVLWHDDFISVRRGDGEVENFAIRDLTLDELKRVSRAAIATAEAAKIGDTRAVKATRSRPSSELEYSGSEGDEFELEDFTNVSDTADSASISSGYLSEEECGERARISKSVAPMSPTEEPVVLYRKFAGTEAPAPWIMDVEDEIPTLHELMTKAPNSLGFSLELKFGTPEDFPGGKKHVRPRRRHSHEDAARIVPRHVHHQLPARAGGRPAVHGGGGDQDGDRCGPGGAGHPRGCPAERPDGAAAGPGVGSHAGFLRGSQQRFGLGGAAG